MQNSICGMCQRSHLRVGKLDVFAPWVGEWAVFAREGYGEFVMRLGEVEKLVREALRGVYVGRTNTRWLK